MLDVKMIIEQKEIVEKSLRDRGQDVSIVDEITVLYQKKKSLSFEIEQLSRESNEASEGFKTCTPEDRPALQAKLKALSNNVKEKKPELRELEEQLTNLLLRVPNLPNEKVPFGKDDSDNPEVRKWSTPKVFDFEPKEHFDLPIEGIDMTRGVKLSGSRFVTYTHKVARLMRGLVNYMLEKHIEAGYVEINPPILVKRETMRGSGQLPKFEDEAYKTTDDMFLVPTSEVSVINMHAGEVLKPQQFPLKYTAYTQCFRRESGSYGKDTRGLIRMHQFNKVELIVFTYPEDSIKELDGMVLHVESLLQSLNIPYRVVIQSTGDMGFTSHITYDLEIWFPGQKKYREVSSCSTTNNFQSRRANIRYRSAETNKMVYPHILNGSGLGMDRALAALIENNQQADGSVLIPKVLVPYCGFEKIEVIPS